MGWGRSWGRVWGGGSISLIDFALLSARPSANNAVQVTFSKPPQLVSPLGPGDSARLQNWALTRTDKAQRLTLMTVRPITGSPSIIEFIIAERWISELATYTIVGADQLVAADGLELIASPATANFLGTPSPVRQTERQEHLFDLFNPQNVNPELFNGGLEMETSGDYAVEEGLTLLKKLIIREIFTAVGEFLHLADTDYGLGVRAKEFFNVSDLQGFRRKLRNNVLGHPEVVSASASVELFPDGRGVINIRAQTDFGPLEVTAPIVTDGSVQF